jgi:phosphatidylserine/phosphatidylglycerophosphate/cardiolipin synthase-like enzyme
VITGSHNLGYRASYANDDNLVVIRGHRRLAEAYAVHVMDVYDHYRWRYVRERYGAKAFTGLLRSDGWQDKYFRAGAALDETRFWTSAAPVPA